MREVRDSVPLNALLPIVNKELPRVRVVNLLAPLNADSPIWVTELGITRDVSLSMPPKALSPIVNKELPRLSEVKLVAPLKA